jgi:signal peptidase I
LTEIVKGPKSGARLFWALLLIGGAGAAFVAYLVAPTFVPVLLGRAKTYNIPAASMVPTLVPGDYVLATRGEIEPIKRGDVVVFRTEIPSGTADYVKRVAAVEGDTIELKGGRVILNGKLVIQKVLRVERAVIDGVETPRTLLFEQFPGELQPHQIYDQVGRTMGDDFATVTVPAGHLFTLGDNRDVSADSRFSKEEFGTGMVPTSKVSGHAYRIYWSTVPGRRGLPVR